MLKKLKNWACENNIDIQFSLWAENLIFKKSLGDFCLSSPYDLLNAILNEIIPKETNISNNNNNTSNFEIIYDTYKDLIETWIQFAIYEYSIYSQFDIFTITLACIYLTIEKITPEIPQEQINNIKENYQHIVSQYKQYFNIEIIDQCSQEILKLFYNEEEKEENNEDNDNDNNVNDKSYFSLDTTITINDNLFYEDIFSIYSESLSNNSLVATPIEHKDIQFTYTHEDNDHNNNNDIEDNNEHKSCCRFLNKKRKLIFNNDSNDNDTISDYPVIMG